MSATGSAFGKLLQSCFTSRTKHRGRSLTFSLTIDVIVFASLLAAGILATHFRKVGRDFTYDDVAYFERARSLVQTGVDGFNGRPETTQPPGLPLILAGLYYLRSCSYGTMLGLMAIFEVLGFAATYLLLRRQIGRFTATAICLLLITSPLYFSMATQWVATAFPFFWVGMSALLAARKLEEAKTSLSRAFWAALLAILGTAAIMIATAGIVLLAAVVLKLAFTFRSDRGLAVRQLKGFAALLLLATSTQGLWMHRKAASLEWPIPGYPRPYLQQLWVKDGHNPELGYATPQDVAVRLGTNLRAETVVFSQLFSGHWVNSGWWSIAIAGPVLTVFLGWAATLWTTGGQSLEAWFFAGYQAVYLLWPWNIDVRFFLPIAPLVCLFLWKGLKAAVSLVRRRPGAIGLMWSMSSAVLAAGCVVALQSEPASAWNTASLIQPKVSLLIWGLSGVGGVLLVRKSWHAPGRVLEECEPSSAISPIMDLIWRALASIAIGVLLVNSFSRDLEVVNRVNLNPNSGVNRATPDVVAAKWIYSNTPSSVVVMARHVPITYYYANRRIVWFPPSSNADLLMEGIGRHRVDYVVAASRKTNYYFPTDDESMAALLARYPSRFQLVAQPGAARIFRVVER